MAVVIILPKQGQSVETCIISKFLKKKGDDVVKGEILFSYETDKATFDEVSPTDGVILECFYNDGDEVPVLFKMMIIGKPGEDYTALLDESMPAVTDSEIKLVPLSTFIQADSTLAKEVSYVQSDKTNESFVSPRAKKLADSKSIDASRLTGSGPNGRVIEKDVLVALENLPKLTPLARQIVSREGLQTANAGSGLAGTTRAVDLLSTSSQLNQGEFEDRKISNVRKIIARSMHASLQNSAQLTHHLGADARRILDLRKKAKKALEDGSLTTNITLNDMVCFAVIKALEKFPNANTHFLGDTLRFFNKVHLAVAIDTDRGLMVPVIRNADDLSIVSLSNQLKETANSCRKGGISLDLLAAESGTFTVSNLGNYGVEMFTPIINLPQSAILGVNTILPRPKDLGDGVYAFVPHIGLSLTYDHRALDGGEATRFLKQIATEIENLDLNLF